MQSVADAVADCTDLKNGATVLVGGFGDAGVPEQLVYAVRDLGLENLTLITAAICARKSPKASRGNRTLAEMMSSTAGSTRPFSPALTTGKRRPS